MNTTRMILMAMLVCASVAHAAEGPSISVTNHLKAGTRRVEIVIQDPVSAAPAEPAPAALPEAGPVAAPEGGQIQGAMMTGGTWYAVTEKRMIAVGEKIAGHTVTEVTLDHVTLSRGARTYELDVNSGEWTLTAAAMVAE